MFSILEKFIVFLSILGMIIFPSNVISSGKNAVELAFFSVLPCLFPFFVLQYLSIEVGVTHLFSKYFGGIFKKIFKVPDISPFILGIIGGYPVGFNAVVKLFEQKKITKAQAERMSAFCNNSGPAFIIGFVGVYLFSNKNIGYILLASHILASITVGIIFSLKQDAPINHVKRTKMEYKPFYTSFIQAVNTSFSSCLLVCGYIIFFSVFAEILICFGVFKSIAYIIQPIFSGIGFGTDEIVAFMIGIIEMSTGINYLSSTKAYIEVKIILASMLLGFGGISIHFQTLNFNKGLSLKKYFIGKTMQAVISPIYSLICYKMLYNYIDVSFMHNTYSTKAFYIINIITLIVGYFIYKRIIAKKSFL